MRESLRLPVALSGCSTAIARHSSAEEKNGGRPGPARIGRGPPRCNRIFTCGTRGRNRSRRFCSAGRERTSHRPVYGLHAFAPNPSNQLTGSWPRLASTNGHRCTPPICLSRGCPHGGIAASFFVRFAFAICPVVSHLSFLSIKKCYVIFRPTGRFSSKSAVELRQIWPIFKEFLDIVSIYHPFACGTNIIFLFPGHSKNASYCTLTRQLHSIMIELTKKFQKSTD